MKVLIVEDEVDTLQLLSVYFETRGNEVTTACDGVEALQKFRLDTPEIVLLDVRLPRKDGWSVLKEIRAEGKVPVIMLTALDSAEDVVKGLTLGADDYLRKPFQLSELEARTRAVLRRVQRSGQVELLRAGPCEIDDRSKSVTIAGRAVSLSPKEYELFKLFATDPGRTFSADEIIARLWPTSGRAGSSDVKQYVYLLRNKVESLPGSPCRIDTVKGFGYRLLV